MKLNSSIFVLLWLVLWLTGKLQINQLQECETLIHSFFSDHHLNLHANVLMLPSRSLKIVSVNL